jgi:hypothetical protein
MKAHLTERFVKAAETDPARNIIARDDEVIGFRLRPRVSSHIHHHRAVGEAGLKPALWIIRAKQWAARRLPFHQKRVGQGPGFHRLPDSNASVTSLSGTERYSAVVR